jgi:hypothetical protein
MRLFPLLLTLGCSDYAVMAKDFSESFFQNDREEGVDILWVVDNSATMYEERDLLTDSADNFIAFVANSSVDFRLAVISTDMDEGAGELSGPVLDTETSGMVDRFIDQIATERVGSRDERGLDAAVLAADPDRSPEFARKRADLELVIFSDEDDHSIGDVSETLSELEDQRDGAAIKVHAVVGDPPAGCVSALAAADVGTRYLEAQDMTGGRRESICTLDYGGMLARVALDVIGLETAFPLMDIPSPQTIELTVDGVAVHRRDVDGWRYNPGDNTIVFDGYAVPRAGAHIEVTYIVWRGPLEDLEEAAE